MNRPFQNMIGMENCFQYSKSFNFKMNTAKVQTQEMGLATQRLSALQREAHPQEVVLKDSVFVVPLH